MIINKNDPNFEYTEEIFQYMIDNHIEFDREDYRMFIECCEIDCAPSEYLDRWTRHITSICKVFDRYFAVEWEEGLTEYQENLFDDTTIIEIYPRDYIKTIYMTSWYNKQGEKICETEEIR